MTNILTSQITLLFNAPGGIEKARRLILDIAVHGLLVDQLPDEGIPQIPVHPESYGEGPIRPHKVPLSWIWAPLSRIGKIVGGGTPKAGEPRYWENPGNGVAWLTPADINGLKGKFVKQGRRDISTLGLRDSSAQLLPAGTVLFSSRAPIGYVAIAAAELATNQGFKSCIPNQHILPEYLYWYLKWCAPLVDSTAPGTTFREVSGAAVGRILVAVPPLAEQHRIVAKVDELMALCDRLEARQQDAEAAHARLVQALLDSLTQARNAQEFQAGWERLAGEFETLFTTEESVDMLLRNCIQLALAGRFATHVSTDDPASSFVRQASFARNEALGARGRKISGSASPAASIDRTVPGMPGNWCRCRVDEVTECLDYLRRPINKSEREGRTGSVPYYGANGQVGWIDEHIFDEKLVLVVEDETFIGRTKPFSYVVQGKSWVNNHAHVLRPLAGMSAEYLNLCLHRYDFIPLTSGTTGRRKLTQAGLNAAVITIAPLAEQERILAKAEEFTVLCDQLKTRIAAGRAKQAQLAEALVKQAVAAAG